MIESQNIISLLKSSKSSTYHSAILTCYTFDPIFFTSYFLPVLRTRRIDQVVVFMDAEQYDSLMEDTLMDAFHDRRKYLQGYTLVRCPSSSGTGVFHPKIFLLIGDKGGELFVGSGNLTYSGLSLNAEVWSSFSCDGQNSECLPIIVDAWNYLSRLSLSSLVAFQMKTVENNAEWLRLAKAQPGGFVEKEGVYYSFVCNRPGESLLSQLHRAIGKESVEKMTVIAPFYDDDASVIRTFHARQNMLFVDLSNGRVPKKIPKDYSVYDWATKKYGSSKLHAKIFQFETPSATYLLVGSANATRSAFGLNSMAMNDEACILMKVYGTRNFVEELGIIPTQKELPHEKLEYDEKTTTKITSKIYQVKIAWAEVKGQLLSLGVEKKNADWMLCIENDKGQSQEMPFATEITLGNSDVHPFIVSIKQGGDIISNRCLVIHEDEVLKTLPNSSSGKLSKYLRNSEGWIKNIANILENVEFEDEDNEASGNSKTGKSTQPDSIEQEIYVEREDYDQSPTSIKSKLAHNKNLMILDFFRGVLEKVQQKQVDKAISSEELETDEGFNEDTLIQKKDEQKQIERLSKQINFFLNRAIAQFQRRLKETLEQKKNENPIRFFSDRNLSKATLNPSSIPAIANALILTESPSEASAIKKRREQFLELSTLACMVFRNGIEAEDSYLKNRIIKNIQYFITSSFLLFAHFTWPKEQRCEMLVSALNVLFLVHHITDNIDEQCHWLETLQVGLIADAQNINLNINVQSVQWVEKVIKAYIHFFKKNKEGNLKHITLLNNSDIIKVQNLFFATFSKFKQNQDNGYEYTYHLPIQCDLPSCATGRKGLISCIRIE